jgi:hypothetical protein
MNKNFCFHLRPDHPNIQPTLTGKALCRNEGRNEGKEINL